jgi:hypothetical protein
MNRKTKCVRCGAAILKQTFERYHGLCAPCHREAVSKPPENFVLPDDLLRRILSANQNPEIFREIVWRDGSPDSAHRLLDSIDNAASEYHRWAPSLRAFAGECRRAAPAPTLESLTGSEREQYHILRSKISSFAASKDHFVVLGGRPHHLAVLMTKGSGLLAVEEVFGGSGAVILEESEWNRWFREVYNPDDKMPWWYAFAWWTFREDISAQEQARIGQRHPPSAGSSYWILRSGVRWGPMMGGQTDELWRWNGERAEFTEIWAHLSW